MRARLRWDALTTQWAVPVNRPTRRGDRVDMVLPPPVHWRFDERMIHDLRGGIAVQATLIVVELEG